MEEQTRIFKREKSTQNKVRFKEQIQDVPELSGFIYLHKWYVGGTEEIKVTIKKKGD